MKLHKEARQLAKKLYRASLTDGQIDPVKVKNLTTAVAEAKPRFYIDALKEFQRLLRLEIQKTHAVIESAVPLDSLSRYEIERDLKKRCGSELSMEFKVTPELIGGLRIRLGSDVWDGSIQARLNVLRDQVAAM